MIEYVCGKQLQLLTELTLLDLLPTDLVYQLRAAFACCLPLSVRGRIWSSRCQSWIWLYSPFALPPVAQFPRQHIADVIRYTEHRRNAWEPRGDAWEPLLEVTSPFIPHLMRLKTTLASATVRGRRHCGVTLRRRALQLSRMHSRLCRQWIPERSWRVHESHRSKSVADSSR